MSGRRPQCGLRRIRFPEGADEMLIYPRFSSFTPAVVLREYIAQANGRFSDFDESDAEEARACTLRIS